MTPTCAARGTVEPRDQCDRGQPVNRADARVGPVTEPVDSRTGVRSATAADAYAIGHLQAQAWRESYRDLLPLAVLPTADALAASWATTLNESLGAFGVVLLALDSGVSAGAMAATAAGDPDLHDGSAAELLLLAVSPGVRRNGHGSRLLTAGVDLLREAGARTFVVWLSDADAELRAFLEATGWAPDGATRLLDLHGDATTVVRQSRLHTDLTAEMPERPEQP